VAGGAHGTLIRGRAVVVVCVLSLVGCDGVLDVDSPDTITDEDLADAANAELQVNSAISLFECGYSAFGWVAMGHEDVQESRAGVTGSIHVFTPTPFTGDCDTTQQDGSWFDQIMGTRVMISNAKGTGVYDRLQSEWQLVEGEERLSATAAIYMAAALDHFGEFYCETAFDGGDMLSPANVLEMAEAWISDRALFHIADGGDFALPNGISTSAETMALALRARIRWARGDLQGAAADAATVPQGFTAWVTRESGPTRRNKIHDSATRAGFSNMPRQNSWWNPIMRRPNPATGLPWADTIPFTGYVFLGVLLAGRTVDDRGYPVYWASGRDFMEKPIPLANGAVPDTRVTHFLASVSGPKPEIPTRYASVEDDIPLVDWEELWLIRAEHEGGQGAIDRVNELRTHAGLPLVTYIDGANATAEQIRYMILEERRRAFYSEAGRYWATKIRNNDVLWFPRAEGFTETGYPLLGGVRLALPEIEYTTNPHFVARGGLAARGTGCDPLEAPVFP
jgi:hypothetical protein